MNKIIRKQNGFTLVELLAGLIILAIGLLAIGTLQITSIKGNYFSHSLTQATIFAQDKMEEFRNLPYNSITTGSDTITASGTAFTRQYNVAENVGNCIKTITVTVLWTDKVDHSISLSTIRAK